MYVVGSEKRVQTPKELVWVRKKACLENYYMIYNRWLEQPPPPPPSLDFSSYIISLSDFRDNSMNFDNYT